MLWRIVASYRFFAKLNNLSILFLSLFHVKKQRPYLFAKVAVPLHQNGRVVACRAVNEYVDERNRNCHKRKGEQPYKERIFIKAANPQRNCETGKMERFHTGNHE